MIRISRLVLASALGLTLVAASPHATLAQTAKKPLADETTQNAKPKRGKPGWTPGVVTSIDMDNKMLVFKDAKGKEMKIQVKGDAAKVQLGTLKVGDAIKVADDPKGTRIMKDRMSLAYDPNIKNKGSSPKS